MKMVKFPLPLAKGIDEFDAAYCLMVTVERNLPIILPVLTSAIKALEVIMIGSNVAHGE
jgi:hypothetical protein